MKKSKKNKRHKVDKEKSVALHTCEEAKSIKPRKTPYFVKRYLIDGLSGMSLGLFSTLIIGLILGQIGKFFPQTLQEGASVTPFYIGKFFVNIGRMLTVFTGAGIGCGVAHCLDVPKLAIYSSIITGTIGAYAPLFLKTITSSASLIAQTGAITLIGPGDPLSAFISALVGAELGRLVYKKTKVDILVVPAVTIIAGCTVAIFIGPYLATAAAWVGQGINKATELQPLLMGIVVSVIMGVLLTLPVSSAAIAIMLGLSGLAGGAATAGCSAQMIGFAIISFRDNKFNGLVSQGLGTSMLQIPNIVKNPLIWIPPIFASAITGPISTLYLKLKTLPSGSGMGTSGLVGQIMTFQAMQGSESIYSILAKIFICHFLLPAILSYTIYHFMRKKGLIHDGDMRLAT